MVSIVSMRMTVLITILLLIKANATVNPISLTDILKLGVGTVCVLFVWEENREYAFYDSINLCAKFFFFIFIFVYIGVNIGEEENRD
jgi:hypothetical protein